MYGYGYGYNLARQSIGASEDTFHPLDLADSQLYFAKNTATPSLWNDQSPNGYDLTQATATQQPTISANSVDFDGVDDFLNRNISLFGSDTEGIIYFASYVTSGVASFLGHTSAFHISNSNFIYCDYSSDNVRLIVRKTDLSVNNVIITDDTFPTGYIYGYVKASNGSYEIFVNGSIRTFTVNSGSNDGAWYDSIQTCTKLSIGALNRQSPVYRVCSVNKSYYNNQPSLLSTSDLTKLNTFFSDPNNY